MLLHNLSRYYRAGLIYHMRWAVEEDYKKMKSHLVVERFTGLSVESVLQDFHAKVFSKNLTRLFTLAAQERLDEQTDHCKRPYQINFVSALSTMKNRIIRLLLNKKTDDLIQWIVERMASVYEALRYNRSFERSMSTAKKYPINYKPAL